MSEKSMGLIIYLVKAMGVFIIGSIIIHLLVMLIDYAFMAQPLYLNLRENFARSIFSKLMIPMMATYGFLSLVIYNFWQKQKRAVFLAHEKEIQKENVKAVLRSMQRLTSILVENIASQNSKIMDWVEFKKRQGSPVSQKIENPNKKISRALQSLSEIAFIVPYTDNRPENVGSIEKILQAKLYEISERQENRFPSDD